MRISKIGTPFDLKISDLLLTREVAATEDAVAASFSTDLHLIMR